MSLDGKYLLHYEPQNYLHPTPMEHDQALLISKHSGEWVKISEWEHAWIKPKWCLTAAEVAELMADQILESAGSDNWRDVTPKR